MKITSTISFLFIFLILACSDDEKGGGKNSNSQSYSSSSMSLTTGTLHLDGLVQSYRTITIGSLIWLAQNLNEMPTSGNWWCYKDIVKPGDFAGNCTLYGKLYDWDAANHVCPSGWHLPSRKEWEDLEDFLLNYGNDLLSGDSWWNATYVGYRHENGSWPIPQGEAGYWWTSTSAGSDIAQTYYTTKGQTSVHSYYDMKKATGLSVRCVKKN